MTTNGPKPSQDPLKDPTSSYDPNRPSSRPYTDPNKPLDANQPYSSNEKPSSPELESTSSSYKRDEDRYTKKDEDHYTKGREGSVEDKFKDTIKNIKDSEIYHYAKSNKETTISYILLAIGIILLFIDSFFGGLIVGAVAGYHFAPEIIYYIRNIGQIFEGQDQLRYIVMTGLLLGLIIAAPGIFIGALIVAAFTELLFNRRGEKRRDYPKNDADFKNRKP